MARRARSPILKCGANTEVILEDEDRSFQTEAEILYYASKQVDYLSLKLDTREAFKEWYVDHLKAGILGPLTLGRFDKLWELWYKTKYPEPRIVEAIEAAILDITKQEH